MDRILLVISIYGAFIQLAHTSLAADSGDTERRLQAAYGFGHDLQESPVSSVQLVDSDDGGLLSRVLLSSTRGDCYAQHLQIYIDKSPFNDMQINTDNVIVHFADSGPRCSAVTSSNYAGRSRPWLLTTLYTQCHTSRLPIMNGYKYTNTIIVSIKDDNTTNRSVAIDKESVMLPFECVVTKNDTVPLRTPALAPSREDSPPSVSLELHDEKGSNRWVTFPRSVPINKPIFAKMDTVSNTDDDDDIRAVPIDCFLSGSDDRHGSDLNKRMLIVSGCPIINEPHVALVHDVRSSSSSSWFTFEVSTSSTSMFLFLHCKATLCSISPPKSKKYKTCPSPRSCSTGSVLHKTVHVVDPPEYVHVFAGPINPIVQSPSAHSNLAGQRIGKLDGSGCAPCPTPSGLTQSRQSTVVVRGGVQTHYVAMIACASFLLGILLVAILWVVTSCTTPERALLLYAKRRNRAQDGESSLASFSTPINNTPTQQQA